MILVGAMCAVLWGIGWAMGAPIKQRWGMIARSVCRRDSGASDPASRPSSADEHGRILAGLGALGRLRGGQSGVYRTGTAQAARQGPAGNE